ncbi:MAG: exosortase/archaeosortase family protein [Phycisphaerae bacterium]|nr:exosortase/archaeosortase family protein [Phycisphaerae bacterium]
MSSSALTGRHGWTGLQLATLALLVAGAVWSCLPAWKDIWLVATQKDDSGYILLAPIVAGYLFWIRRSRLRFVRCRTSLLGPAILVGGYALTWLGDERDIHLAEHLGAIVAVVGAVVTMTGLEVLRQFGAVFLSLLFLLPVPGSVRHEIAGPLQLSAAKFTTGFLELIGVPAIREGAVIRIKDTPVAVGEACDGMRMVFALVLVVFAFVFSVPLRPVTRITLIALSPLVALVCNVLRLVPTSLVYGFADPATAQSVHDVAGWLMLPAALLMLLGIVRLMRWLDLPVFRWRLLAT